MNERIRQLAEQASNTTTSYYDGRGNVTQTVFDKEKFAELIVRECAEIADTGRPNSVGCGYITKTNGMRIKEHFGVEE
jgi:hypothetical protein